MHPPTAGFGHGREPAEECGAENRDCSRSNHGTCCDDGPDRFLTHLHPLRGAEFPPFTLVANRLSGRFFIRERFHLSKDPLERRFCGSSIQTDKVHHQLGDRRCLEHPPQRQLDLHQPGESGDNLGG
jgi:hypothetical protein